ncbi:UDP-N-acetylmuramoyl-L-alanyl-D-glutamate--2,6-diaminopimelate ligase [Clostridium guangxiense]|uniref:UDP-N-acetylmuramoyl-L-alanyl-D-glutamate--2, 6-diaminopimelate ligase n=1 Tax=Clostridium guangxiense TaxID=1662055 RepID=UPI001E2F89CA|nr:UDP-N-acetylmuramoyl-L-alanyl-D-glutamate--2,6-diaminopimelate ligase [Clostridium guangxiense]MCD2345876.1 UDP-N-acetylmuramoyl-L-alanyl-D-glutamate--2,6-diaminopimelate ligase [Clostridium guangxiense]
MKLVKLLKDINYDVISGNINIDIKGISYDSRKVQKDFVFICIRGTRVNGHNYIKEAINNGASAIIIEEEVQFNSAEITLIKVKNTKITLASAANLFYGEPSKKINLIGITGTNGKTSVSHYVRDILEEHGQITGVIGTLGYELTNETIDVKKINPTTPEALELQNILKEFVYKGAKNAVMEVTSSALLNERVDFCDFNIGVFTNLSPDHLDIHGTMENYKNEKMKLFQKCKIGVINLDDKIANEIIEKSPCSFLTYGIDTDADIKAFDISYTQASVSFKISYKEISRKITVNIPGKFTVYNILAAVGICLSLGMDINQILALVPNIKRVPGRLEMIKNSANKNVIVDYAHTPDALEKLLLMARDITKGKLITVFGCGGDRDKSKRKVMGMAAGILSDYCIITSDNPRTEDPKKIIEEIEDGMSVVNSKYEKIVDRKKAIEKGLNILTPNDLLIIAGKGHESYQIIGNEKIHFDDRETVDELLG